MKLTALTFGCNIILQQTAKLMHLKFKVNKSNQVWHRYKNWMEQTFKTTFIKKQYVAAAR